MMLNRKWKWLKESEETARCEPVIPIANAWKDSGGKQMRMRKTHLSTSIGKRLGIGTLSFQHLECHRGTVPKRSERAVQSLRRLERRNRKTNPFACCDGYHTTRRYPMKSHVGIDWSEEFITCAFSTRPSTILTAFRLLIHRPASCAWKNIWPRSTRSQQTVWWL